MEGQAAQPTGRELHFPSDFTISARLSSWCPNAVQLREMLKSTAERLAEFFGSAPWILKSAAYALHCSMDGICAPAWCGKSRQIGGFTAALFSLKRETGFQWARRLNVPPPLTGAYYPPLPNPAARGCGLQSKVGTDFRRYVYRRVGPHGQGGKRAAERPGVFPCLNLSRF